MQPSSPLLLITILFALCLSVSALDIDVDSGHTTPAKVTVERRSAGIGHVVYGRDTNAARFARGLGPIAPKFMKRGSGHHRSQTRVRQHHPSQCAVSPSPTPAPTITGIIHVNRASDGSFVGYVDKRSSDARFGVTTDPALALGVTFVVQNAPFDVLITNPPYAAHPYLGFTIGPGSDSESLGATSINYAILISSSQTPRNSPPFPAGNSYSNGNSESAVWSYIGSQLTATWVNPDNNPAPSTLYYYIPSNILGIVGDPIAFNNAFTGGFPITLTIV